MSTPEATPPAGEPDRVGPWERSYLAFETPEQARAKIERRLRRFGVEGWDRGATVVELFCGAGHGLEALEAAGFQRLEGMDLSAQLAARYRGAARVLVGDCRHLPFEAASRGIVIVHGGLHHLETLEDVERVLEEVARVLVPGGLFCVVEPWRTPFLRLVLAAAGRRVLRRAWSKLDAFQTMVEHERETYERWLAQPDRIEGLFRSRFDVRLWQTRFGFLTFVGAARAAS